MQSTIVTKTKLLTHSFVYTVARNINVLIQVVVTGILMHYALYQ